MNTHGRNRARKRTGPPVYNRKKIVLAASILVLIVLGMSFMISRVFSGKRERPLPGPAAESAAPAGVEGSASPPVWETRINIPPGATLAGLLRNRGFSNQEIHLLKESVKPVYDLAKIKAGRELRIVKPIEGGWLSMEYGIDEASYLAVRNSEAGIRADIKFYPFEFRPAVVWGLVRDNLYAAVNEAGEKDPLALDLEERCFGWDVDFHTDIRSGDSFKVLVEKRYLEGRFTGYGNIIAAEFTNAGKTFRAFRFVYPDTGAADYFDEHGNSKRTEFLKSPLKGGRVTSRFTSSRLHPIYKVYRPHYGVDYGAPVGTPVQSTGDGRVTFVGWNGDSGRMIRIQHKNGYETMYLHLRGYASGIKKGVSVRGGDLIGYVGSSGGSTGPHLDYRIRHYGKYINPLGVKFKPADPLRREFLDAFKREVDGHRIVLETPKILAVSRLAVLRLIS